MGYLEDWEKGASNPYGNYLHGSTEWRAAHHALGKDPFKQEDAWQIPNRQHHAPQEPAPPLSKKQIRRNWIIAGTVISVPFVIVSVYSLYVSAKNLVAASEPVPLGNIYALSDTQLYKCKERTAGIESTIVCHPLPITDFGLSASAEVTGGLGPNWVDMVICPGSGSPITAPFEAYAPRKSPLFAP